MPVSRPALVFMPFFADRLRIEVRLALQTRLSQKVSSPLLEWTPQPVIDGNPEAHLRTLGQRLRHVSRQELTERPFASPVPNALARGDAPRKFRDAMIEEGSAG